MLIVVAVKDRTRADRNRLRQSRPTSPTASPARSFANTITPEFRQGRYGAGLLAGDDAHHQPDRRWTRRHRAGRSDGRAPSGSAGRPQIPFSLIIFVIFIIIVLASNSGAAGGGATGAADRGAAGTAASGRSAAAAGSAAASAGSAAVAAAEASADSAAEAPAAAAPPAAGEPRRIW